MNIAINRKYGLLAGSLLALALIAFGVWYRSTWDRRRIENNLSSILELVGKGQAESAILSLSKTRKAVAYLDDRVSVHFGGELADLDSRNACAVFLHQMRALATSLTVNTYDRKTTLSADRRQAVMNLTVEALVQYAGEANREVRKAQIDWIKTEGDWLIRKAAVVQPIQPPRSSTVE